MNNKMKAGRWIFLFQILEILFCSIWMGMTVRAAQGFSIQAEVLPSDKPTYDVRLTIENQGADWEGTVRLTISAAQYREPNDCAYDTALSLPQGSMKQFVVKIPKESIARTDGTVKITLLDQKSGQAAESTFPKLLQGGADFLSMGILSDGFSALTYLDMGGNELYFYNGNYPIKLMQLDQDNLTDALDALDFLIIDSYNTSVLAESALKSIEEWMSGGGLLLVGTGNDAEDVLSGLDYLEIHCAKVYQPGDAAQSVDTGDAYMDVSQMHLAELTNKNDMYSRSYGTIAMVSSWGKGAVGVLPYSLSELGGLDAESFEIVQEDFVQELLNDVGNYADLRYRQSQYDMDDWYNGNFLGFLGNGSNNLQFGGLKLIVILYVIFVGPVLYLLLRFLKKRDFYWLAVPASALVGIFLVYFAGRGFEVKGTSVYSVTMEDLSGNEAARTYLHCYDAGHKEWDLRLSEEYNFAGPLMGDYNGSSAEGKYYQHIKREGDRYYFGISPNTSFEDCFFVAGSAGNKEEGRITSDITISKTGNASGTVSNETGRDFQYFAIIAESSLIVYKNLPAGETADLSAMEIIYASDDMSYYGYDYMREVKRKEEKNLDSLVALSIGFTSAHYLLNNNPDAVVVIGVTQDWDNVVDDNCSETSYGCLYTVQ